MNIATLLLVGIRESAFWTNCSAYLYGGLVIISPLNGCILSMARKSRIVVEG